MSVYDDELPPLAFVAAGETEEQQDANLEMVEPSPGFPTLTNLIADAIEKRSELTVLDYTANQVNIRFQIDGLWHSMAPMDRESGDYMLAALKQLAGLDYRDRRNRQEGKFRADYQKEKHKCRIVSQGVRTGERVAVYIDIPKPKLDSIEDLGMRASMKEKLSSVLERGDAGMTLVVALPGEGYTSAWRGVLGAADRFTRDYYVIEEASRVEPEVINVASQTYDESAGQKPFDGIPQLLLREPDFISFSEVKDGQVLDQICDLSQQHDLPTMTRIHGKNCLDGLLRLMVLNSDWDKLFDTLHTVVAMRIIRTLCDECRVAFRPNPMLLQKLGIPPGRIHQLYKPFVFKPEMVDEEGNPIEVCPKCSGIGYHGRTGLFEMLTLTEPLKQFLKTSPNINQLVAEAKKHRHISMREEGVLMVAQGRTSIEELQRVLSA